MNLEELACLAARQTAGGLPTRSQTELKKTGTGMGAQREAVLLCTRNVLYAICFFRMMNHEPRATSFKKKKQRV